MIEHLISFAERMGHWTYLVVFIVVAMECQAVVGLLMPGESLVLASGFLAAKGIFDLDDLIFVVAMAAIVGDSIGYELGRRLGREWLLGFGVRFGFREETLAKVDAFFVRHGGKGVFMSHFMHIGRALMPFLAGSSRMPYGRFFCYNVAGCIVWANVFVLLGYFLGESWQIVEKWVGRAGKIGILITLALLAIFWFRHKCKSKG